MNISPQNTLLLLTKLENLGFNNNHFQFIHHWGGFPNKDSSLESHKDYLSHNKNYIPGSNNFKVAIQLQKCLDIANTMKGTIDFDLIFSQIDKNTEHVTVNDKSTVNCLSGLYIVTLNNSKPISANADDPRRADTAIKVNNENCKFGNRFAAF